MPDSPNLPFPANRPFFGRVEALRGLGALAVAAYHFTGCVVHGTTLLQPALWADAGPAQHALARLGLALIPGHAALMMFFVISGFVLRVSLDHGPARPAAATARFLVARLFRVYPIVAVGVVVAGLTAAAAPSAQTWAANLLLFDVSLNSTLWAIQVELLVVPVILGLFFLERRSGPWVLPAVAAATTALAFVPRWAGWPPLSTNLFAFVLGMAIPTYGRRLAVRLSGRAAALGALAAGVMFAAGPCLGFYSRPAALAEAYAATLLLSLIAYGPDLSFWHVLDAKVIRRLGAASGSYYVLHMATVPVATAVAGAVVPAAWSAAAPAAVGLGVIAVWVVAIAPLAVLVSRLVEEPGIVLGRRINRALGLDAPARAATPASPDVRRAA